jgi:hypothetical protein
MVLQVGLPFGFVPDESHGLYYAYDYTYFNT